MYWALSALRVNACGYVMVLVCWNDGVALCAIIEKVKICVGIPRN